MMEHDQNEPPKLNQPTPYTPPNSDVEQNRETDALEVIPVSRWLRLANYIIDYIGMVILVVILMVLQSIIMGEESLATIEKIPDFLLGIILIFIYYLPLEAATGRTLGKLVTGTKVVNARGMKVGFTDIMMRTLSRMVPFEPLSVFRSSKRCWHDSWSKSYVVKCR